MASLKVNINLPRFQGDPTNVFQGGGGQTFFQGGGFRSLIDRTCDLYWTHVPLLDLHNDHEFYSATVILFLAVYFRLSPYMYLK